jgi:two-component system, LytTR family, sensor histidine kinase AlgZ
LRPSLLMLWAVGILLYVVSVAIHYAMLAMEASAQSEQRAIKASVLARDAELRALKAQINPHFLFNSLHSISALTSMDPAKAREMCLALSDFLRMTLGLGEKVVILLSDELSLLRSYLAVEKIRFGSRMDMKEEVDPAVLNCLVPPLLLQPLIENAVSHGMANLPQGGWIRLTIRENGGGTLLVDVQNNFDPDAPPRRKNGLGLRNVQGRLETRYGKKAKVKINKEAEQFEVELSFPAERASAQ